jgi:2-methylcitrate dehydratase PrpD
MMTGERQVASVTETLANWIVAARYEDIPAVGVERVRERFLDSLGVAYGGMSAPAGRTIARWIQALGARPEANVLGAGFRTTAAFAALANATAGHALEFDDIASFGGHYANPLTAASLALGQKLGASGRDVILAWMVGWEVIAQTSKVCLSQRGNELLNRGWFNQGFQPALGVAALSAKLMGCDVAQTRMALGHAASTMAGVLKNRGSDTKSFVAGSAAMHGIMAAELVTMGFTANEDIIDGEFGVARLLGLENGDPEKVLANLGSWDMATNGSAVRVHACCGASHWSQDALQKILLRRPTRPEEIEAIEVEINDFLMPMVPYHDPQTGLEAKYSLEYDMAAIALDGRAGMHEYTDAMVQRPEARAMMRRVIAQPQGGGMSRLQSRVVLRLKNGELHEETVNRARGTVGDPLSWDEIADKFHDCAGAMLQEAERLRVIDLCRRLDALSDIGEMAAAIGGEAVQPNNTSKG